MLLQVTHETSYRYAPPVETAQHLAHLTPREGAGQHVHRHELSIAPAPAQRHQAADVYGNIRTFFSLRSTHGALLVAARSVVETSERLPPRSDIGWEQARERLRFRHAGGWEPAAEFTFASPQAPRDPQLAAYALPSFAPGRALQEAAHDLMRRIHADFDYRTTATDAATPALAALALRQGVCQDFAHVMIGCLRSLGLAARYVSGYLLTQPPPGATRLVGSDASHAWVSLYLPGSPGAWIDLDPTNCRVPGADYVTLAIGRDYADVAPLRGVIEGGARHQLQVAVTVQPLPAGSLPGGPLLQSPDF